MMTIEEQFRFNLLNIRDNGVLKGNRTGNRCKSIFNTYLSSGELFKGSTPNEIPFPVMTCRKYFHRGAIVEMFWLLGILQEQNPIPNLHRNNIAYLEREGVKYWNKWADKDGNLGEVYGKQLIEWAGNINQIELICEKLKNSPDDRRMLYTMWNPSELENMALPPCHYGGEFYSKPLESGERELSLRWVQRSADYPIGVPYNIMMYSLLLFMVAKLTNHKMGELHGLFGDSHIYEDQLQYVDQMVEAQYYDFPTLKYSGAEKVEKLSDFKLSDFEVVGYEYDNDMSIPVTV